ncbi:hypothetical protein ACFLX7_03025 [Chloroflexota bacterium]
MSRFDLEQFYQTVDRIREKAIAENRLRDNPSDKEFRALLAKEPGIQKTIYEIMLPKANPVPGQPSSPEIVLIINLARKREIC